VTVRRIGRNIAPLREQVRQIAERKLAEVAARGETHQQWIFQWVYALPDGEYEAELFAAPLPRAAFAGADLGPIEITALSIAGLVNQIRIDREHWQDEWMDLVTGQDQRPDVRRAGVAERGGSDRQRFLMPSFFI
jgi:hypothetical protein